MLIEFVILHSVHQFRCLDQERSAQRCYRKAVSKERIVQAIERGFCTYYVAYSRAQHL
jgi:hypothetical protein